LPASWRLALVIGAAASDDPGLDQIAGKLGARLAIHRHVEDMAALMAKADLALASFGMTAYELAAVGVPMLLLCLSEDHLVSAASLAEAGAAEIAGIAKDVSDAALDAAIAALAADDARHEQLGRRARALIDGKGAARIAESLAALGGGQDMIAKAARASVPA
jgi:spore coat polysaccharide biosynthesis protein SpsF